MKGRFWKKALAATLALLIVSGGVPIQPLSQVFDRTAITAEAAQEQIITYTIEREATGGRYIYYLVGSDGTSNILIDSKDASPTRVTIDMGDDVTFDVYAGGSIISCGGESKEKASIVGFNNYLNSSNLYITITSKTHAVRHIHVDGSGYKDFKAAKTSMEFEGKEQSLEVHWVKGSGGTRMGVPGKFVVTFASPVKTYNINYNLNGGTNSASNPSTYDDDQNLTLASPTREGYTFDGWYTNSSFTGSPVKNIPVGSSGDKNLYAKWNINKYNITWKNYDGSVLKNDVFDYGNKPSYSGSTPTKPKDAQYTYKFSGWSPAITTVTGNQTYTAQYSSTLNTYTVTWKNGDKILKRDNSAPYGSTPVYDGETPTKEDDSKFYYTFTGWSPDVKTVSCNALYTATYALTPKTYTVTYMVDGEVYGEPDTVAYGMTLIPRKIPVQKGYTFSGWSEMPKTMPDEDIVVTGTFSQDDYNIIIPDDMENGSVVSNKATAHYGDRVTLKITPESGYYIKCVNAGSAIVTRSGEGIYSFNMPAEDVTVSVELLKKIPAKAATCTEDGYIEHYVGANGKIYITVDTIFFETVLDAVIIDKTGHSYDEPVWDWSEDNSSASAKFTCAKCGDEQTVDAVITSETIAPTFEADGKIVYTATTFFEDTEYTATKEVVLPKKELVATVGDKKYDSLKAAIDAAYSDETVVLYADVDEPNVTLGCDQTWGCYNKNIQIDMNGHTATYDMFATNYSITIKNGTLNCKVNNVSNYFATLKLDNAVLNTPEAEDEYSQCISWMADCVELKNGSTMVLNGNAYFNGWYSDPFSFDIDETSSVIMNNVMLSCSNEEAVLAEIGEYLPTGYSFGKLEDEYSYRIFNADGEVVTDPVTLRQKKKEDSKVPVNIKVTYSAQYHQVRFTWDKVKNADRYGIAVYLAGKWRVQAQNITDTVYTSPKNLTPGKTYKVAIAARVNGKWDTANAVKNAVTITIK